MEFTYGGQYDLPPIPGEGTMEHSLWPKLPGWQWSTTASFGASTSLKFDGTKWKHENGDCVRSLVEGATLSSSSANPEQNVTTPEAQLKAMVAKQWPGTLPGNFGGSMSPTSVDPDVLRVNLGLPGFLRLGPGESRTLATPSTGKFPGAVRVTATGGVTLNRTTSEANPWMSIADLESLKVINPPGAAQNGGALHVQWAGLDGGASLLIPVTAGPVSVVPRIVLAGSTRTIQVIADFAQGDLSVLDDFDPTSSTYVHFLRPDGTDITDYQLVPPTDGSPPPEPAAGRITVTEQRLILVDGHLQRLEMDCTIGASVPYEDLMADVNLGAIHAYPDELSQENTGANGAYRMKEALAVCKVQVNPIELWQLEDKQYTIRVAGKESAGNQPPDDENVWLDVVLTQMTDAEAKAKVKSWTLNWTGMEPHCFYLKQGSGAFEKQGNQGRIAVDDTKARFLGGMAGETSADQLHDSRLSIYDYTITGDGLAELDFDEGIDGQVFVKHRKIKQTLAIDNNMKRAPYGATTLFGNWAKVEFDLGVGETAPNIKPTSGLVGANDKFKVQYDGSLTVAATDSPVEGDGTTQAAPILLWIDDSSFTVGGEKNGDTIVQVCPVFTAGSSSAASNVPLLEIPIQVDLPVLSEPGLFQIEVARENLVARQNFLDNGVLQQKATPVPPSDGANDPDWRLPDSYRAQYGVIDQANTENTKELDSIFEFCMYMIAQIVPASMDSLDQKWYAPISGPDSIFNVPATQANLSAPAVELSRDQYWQIWNMAGLAVGGQPTLNSLGNEQQAAEAWRARIVKSGPPLQAWLRFAKHWNADFQVKRQDPEAIKQRQLLEVKLMAYMDQAALARLKRYFSVMGNYRQNTLPVNRLNPDGSVACVGPDTVVNISYSFWQTIGDAFLKTSPLTRMFDTKITPNWHVGHPFTEEVVHWMIAERMSWAKKLLSEIQEAPGSDEFPIRTDSGADAPANNIPLDYSIDPGTNRIYFYVPDRFLMQGTAGSPIFIRSDLDLPVIGFAGGGANNKIDSMSPDGFRLTVTQGILPHSPIDIIGADDRAKMVVRLMQEIQVLEHILDSRAVDAFWTNFRNQTGPTKFFVFCVADFVAGTTDIYQSIWGQDVTGQKLSPEARMLSGMMVGLNVIMGGVPGTNLAHQGMAYARNTIAKDAMATAKQMMTGIKAEVKTAVEDMAQGGNVIGKDVAKAGFGTMKAIGESVAESVVRRLSFLDLPIEDLFKSHAGFGRMGDQIVVRAGSQAPHCNPLISVEKSAVRRASTGRAVRASPTKATAAEMIAANEDLSMAQRVVSMGKAEGMTAKDCGDLLNSVPQCFPAGTKVLMGDGTWKNIEAIERGDEVASRNQWHFDSIKSKQRVCATIVSDADELVVLTIGDANGVQSTIRCTTDHPFWLAGKGWTSAKDLAVGSELLGGDAGLHVASNVIVSGPTKVYNLEVANDRTYFVSSISLRGPPAMLWVHNANCALRGQIEQYIQKNATELGYQLTEKQKILAIEALEKRAASGGSRGLFVKTTLSTGTSDTLVNRLINRIELTEGTRRVVWVAEKPTGNTMSQIYERAAQGHLFDAISSDSVVPALPFKNARPGFTISDFKKFDGILRNADGSLTTTLIDRKLVSLATVQKSGFRENMRRTVLCLVDPVNRSAGYTCILQVPDEAVRAEVEKLVQRSGGSDVITVQVVHP